MASDSCYYWREHDLFLKVSIQPGARRDEIVEVLNNALKIKITAPPVEGKANKYLCAYLARFCKVKKSKVCIESGLTARTKTVKIQLEEQKLPVALARFLSK